MDIENLSGNILDKNNDPISNAKISIYQKVGEVFSNEDGSYENIIYNQTDEYVAVCSKDEYFSDTKDIVDDLLDFNLMKDDNLIEPLLPDNVQIVDVQDSNSILISWSEVDFEFILGYNIYRSTGLQESFERINVGIIEENSYLDSDLELSQEYYYILEVVSANNPICYGIISRTAILGPFIVEPIISSNDITDYVIKVKVDSTKTNREAEKIFDDNDNTWWESQRGADAWIEIILDERRNIDKFYFKKALTSLGILFATLQYWDYDSDNWIDIQNLNYLTSIDYMFENFLVNTDIIRLYVNNVEPLTETQISKIIVYGE